MTHALQIIRQEHYGIASVLTLLRQLSVMIEEGRYKADLRLLEAIIDYMEAFPETFHHPKEDQYLMPALRRRAPEAAALLDSIEAEHAEGIDRLADLRRAFEDFAEKRCDARAFRAAVAGYVRFERRHMWREEQEVLPLALRKLLPEDWVAINEAFGNQDDPLFGRDREARFDRLFSQIVERAPAPYGYFEGNTAERRKVRA